MTPAAGSKQERVYAAIRERILNGVYSPGFRLVIDRIADEFRISALPVREAIRRLEAEGLVVFRPNVGPQVSPADPYQYEQSLAVLAVLEGYVTAQVAASLTPTQLRELDDDNHEMVECVERLDMLGFSHANRRFHHRMYDACTNPALQDLLRSTESRLDAIRRTVFVHIPYRGMSSIEEHRHIVQLIRTHAPAVEIEAAARRHKMQTLDAFRDWLDTRGDDHLARLPVVRSGSARTKTRQAG